MAAALPEEVLQARVAALRKLAQQDVVPAIQETVQLCQAGGEVVLHREVAGAGRLVGYTKPVSLRFEAPEDIALRVSEAAVVLGATASRMPAATWRDTRIVELGSGAGYAGCVLAALGARVVLTDLPSVAGLATASISLNVSSFRPPASASFSPLDWSRPRAPCEALAALAQADMVVAAEPVFDEASERDFLRVLEAVLGLDGEAPLCRNLKALLVVHKHQQSYCISGYSAPTPDARPTITHAEECSRCIFRRSLEDAGMAVRPWQAPPRDFAHPFVESWVVSRATRG